MLITTVLFHIIMNECHVVVAGDERNEGHQVRSGRETDASRLEAEHRPGGKRAVVIATLFQRDYIRAGVFLTTHDVATVEGSTECMHWWSYQIEDMCRAASLVFLRPLRLLYHYKNSI